MPVTFDALLTAPVPSLCDKPAGNLVDGILPGVPENEGGVWLFGIGWTPADDPSTRVMAVGDLTSDGADDAVVAIACFAGGVGWPTGVHLYGSTTRPTPEHLAHVVLADVFDLEWEHRESVEAIAVRDDRFTVDWATHAPGDPMCCPSLRVRGSFRWHDSSVETGDVEILQDTRLVSTIAPDSYPDPETCRRSDAPVASSGPDGAALAAMCFYQAFALDDAEMARRYAEATVVDSTFRIPWPIDPLSWVFHGCSTGPERPGWSNLGCTFTTSIPGGDDLVIDVAFAPQGNTMLISSIESAADYGD